MSRDCASWRSIYASCKSFVCTQGYKMFFFCGGKMSQEIALFPYRLDLVCVDIISGGPR